jgi:hypothetical protein
MEDVEKKSQTGILTKIIVAVLILLILGLIAVSFSVFQTPPNLGYLLIFYCTIGMVVLGIVVILLLKGFKRIFSAITIIGSAILIFTSLVFSDNDLTMIFGQFVSVISFISNTVMLFYVVLKKA